tara:strand:- start:697 stop:879 length:183 start_codon:yes stop_codon:yes gene_type:complete
MTDIEHDPYDELREDDTVEVEVEHPRDTDGHPGPFASVAQIVAYYERLGVFSEEDNALGS